MELVPKETVDRLSSIFMPHNFRKRQQLRESKRQLIHYTTGENALRIISEKKVLFRSTVCMNDYSEVLHGHQLLLKCLNENNNQLRNAFTNCFEAHFPRVVHEAFGNFDRLMNENRYRVYVACLSEHDPVEDRLGRLSMWRAYGKGATGVGLVLDKAPLDSNAQHVGFVASAVAYLTDAEAKMLIEEIVQNICDNMDYLAAMQRVQIHNLIVLTFLFGAVCVKHHAFAEEREWRLIHIPGIFPGTDLEELNIVINGVPQLAYKLPLADDPSRNLVGIEIPSLLQKVIIGPTPFPFPFPVAEAFIRELRQANVNEPADKVFCSGVPLRT